MAKNNIPNNRNANDINIDNKPKNWSLCVKTSIIWLIVILLIVIVCLLTILLSEKMVNGDALLESLVNFATVLSIFLSVSSICFALYTSLQTTRQYDNMSQAVTEIKVTNSSMDRNNTMLFKYIKEITKEIAYLGGRIEKDFNNKQTEDKDFSKERIPSNNDAEVPKNKEMKKLQG